jgi:hypothetical protein
MTRSQHELSAGIDDDFRSVIDQLRALFLGITRQRRGRATHTYGAMATGIAYIIGSPAIPRSDFIEPGNAYLVAVRHSRPSGSSDDATRLDAGGVAVKLFHLESRFSGQGFHDVVMNTGRALFVGTARDFLRLVTTPVAERPAKLIATGVLDDDRLAECFRDSGSFADYYYHSQLAYEYWPHDGSAHYLRYRLISADRGPERGVYGRGFRPEGRTAEPRAPEDRRAQDHLREDFRTRVRLGLARYLLQIQLRPMDDPSALDARKLWDEHHYPWHDFARIELDTVVSDAEADRLDMDANRTHPCIKLPLATSADGFASLGHARALIYPEASRLRHQVTEAGAATPSAQPAATPQVTEPARPVVPTPVVPPPVVPPPVVPPPVVPPPVVPPPVVGGRDAAQGGGEMPRPAGPAATAPGTLDPTRQHALNFVVKIRGSTPAEVRQSYMKLAAIVRQLRPDPLNAIGTVHFGRFVFLDPAEDDAGRYFRTLAVFTAYDHDFEAYVQDFVAHTSPLFDAILPLVESPEDLVPVSRNASGFGAFLLANGARALGRLYSAYPGGTALQIRTLAERALGSLPPGGFEPAGQSMLNFVVPIRGCTPAEVKANSDQIEAVFKVLRAEPLNAIQTVHFGRFLLLDRVEDPKLGTYYRTLAVLTSYNGDFRTYVQGFVDEVSPFFDRVLTLVDAPDHTLVPVRRNADAFAAFLAENGKQSQARFYSGYPGLTMLQIRQLLGAP